MKKNKFQFLKFVMTPLVIIIIGFVIWMVFFDTHNVMLHRELNKEIEAKQKEKEFYKNEIEKDRKEMKSLNTDEGTERQAREKYYMKKEDEDIYIIVYKDSLENQKKDE